jgi:Ca2+-binding RTX toxin-like protein
VGLAVALVFVLASAPGALASVASVSSDLTTAVVVDGAESSTMSTGRALDNTIYFSDENGITAGAHCSQTSSTEVNCGNAGTTAVGVSLGGGNDDFEIRSADFSLLVEGESGNDKVHEYYGSTFEGDAEIDGGPGDDRLSGTDIGDTINGDDGNDNIDGGFGTGADVIHGGTGNDRLIGNSGNDVMHGDAGNDDVEGIGGNDQVFGDAGNDTVDGDDEDDYVDGGSGEDVLAGDSSVLYSGNDKINSRDGYRDSVSCNAGADSVTADGFDVIEGHGACESVSISAVPGSATCVAAKKALKKAKKAYKKAKKALKKAKKRFKRRPSAKNRKKLRKAKKKYKRAKKKYKKAKKNARGC